MLADTTAIHDLGSAQARHASDLEQLCAALATVADVGAHALGHVGARFAAALTEALAAETRELARIGERSSVAASAARGSAEAYDAADGDAGRLLARSIS